MPHRPDTSDAIRRIREVAEVCDAREGEKLWRELWRIVKVLARRFRFGMK